MSLVSKRELLPGEEITVSYNYRVEWAPVWYQQVSKHGILLEQITILTTTGRLGSAT